METYRRTLNFQQHARVRKPNVYAALSRKSVCGRTDIPYANRAEASERFPATGRVLPTPIFVPIRGGSRRVISVKTDNAHVHDKVSKPPRAVHSVCVCVCV